MKSRLLYIVILLLTYSCGRDEPAEEVSSVEPLVGRMDKSHVLTKAISDSLEIIPPLEYLAALAFDNEETSAPPYVLVRPPGMDWISYSHVGTLMPWIDSPQSAVCVLSVYASYLPKDNHLGTIGGHAMELIESYRFGRQYPPLGSCDSTDIDRADELRVWWKNGGHQEALDEIDNEK